MRPRLIPAAFGAVSWPVAGGAKAAARRNTDAIVVFTRTLYSESTTPGRSTRASNRSSASSSRRPRTGPSGCVLVSELGEATRERGGKAKRYFRVTAKGLAEVAETRRALTELWARVPALQGKQT